MTIFESLLTRPQYETVELDNGKNYLMEIKEADRVPEEDQYRLELAAKVLAYTLTCMEYELTADARDASIINQPHRGVGYDEGYN